MVRGLLTALGVMFICAALPVAQALLAPFGPFLGAYFGIRWVDTGGRGPLGAAVRFGCVVAGASGIILIVIAVILMLTLALPPRFLVLLWIAVVVFTLYVAGMSTLGGMYRLVKMQAAAGAKAPATGAGSGDKGGDTTGAAAKADAGDGDATGAAGAGGEGEDRVGDAAGRGG